MSGMKKAIGGSIHRIREFELEKVMRSLFHFYRISYENRSQSDFAEIRTLLVANKA